jgi:hypothetical protein
MMYVCSACRCDFYPSLTDGAERMQLDAWGENSAVEISTPSALPIASGDCHTRYCEKKHDP